MCVCVCVCVCVGVCVYVCVRVCDAKPVALDELSAPPSSSVNYSFFPPGVYTTGTSQNPRT